jgi:hypothetical protein
MARPISPACFLLAKACLDDPLFKRHNVSCELLARHWFGDRWSWSVWAHRVRRYINITESQAPAIDSGIPNYKYIYFR